MRRIRKRWRLIVWASIAVAAFFFALLIIELIQKAGG